MKWLVAVVPMLLIGGLYGRILGRIFVDLFGVQVRPIVSPVYSTVLS